MQSVKVGVSHFAPNETQFNLFAAVVQWLRSQCNGVLQSILWYVVIMFHLLLIQRRVVPRSRRSAFVQFYVLSCKQSFSFFFINPVIKNGFNG